MVFSSLLFLFRFLPLFLALYFAAPKRLRNTILFIGSLIFYGWGGAGVHLPPSVFYIS